jgi:hypothetical protein
VLGPSLLRGPNPSIPSGVYRALLKVSFFKVSARVYLILLCPIFLAHPIPISLHSVGLLSRRRTPFCNGDLWLPEESTGLSQARSRTKTGLASSRSRIKRSGRSLNRSEFLHRWSAGSAACGVGDRETGPWLGWRTGTTRMLHLVGAVVTSPGQASHPPTHLAWYFQPKPLGPFPSSSRLRVSLDHPQTSP